MARAQSRRVAEGDPDFDLYDHRGGDRRVRQSQPALPAGDRVRTRSGRAGHRQRVLPRRHRAAHAPRRPGPSPLSPRTRRGL